MKNEVHLSFSISGFDDMTHDELTNLIGIAPSKIFVKGEKKNPAKLSSVSLHNTNVWFMSSSLAPFGSFEDQMNEILDAISSRIEVFKQLCDKYYCEFSCAVFIRFDNDESTPWLHLGKRYNAIIAELNIDFDLDLYCVPNE